MAKYKLTSLASVVQDTESGEWIPENEGNAQWQAYQVWLGEGGVPDPAFTPAEIIENERLERQSGRIATLQQGFIDMFDMILALFQVGRDKGVWVVADFPAELVTKAQEWRALIDDYRGDEP